MEGIIVALVVIGALSVYSLIFAILTMENCKDLPKPDKKREDQLNVLFYCMDLNQINNLNNFARNLNTEKVRCFHRLGYDLQSNDEFLLSYLEAILEARSKEVQVIDEKLLDKAKK